MIELLALSLCAHTRNTVGDSLTDVKGEVQFDCYWYSEVPSLLQWYKDNVMLNDTTRITGTSTNLLSVSNIAGSDFGVYQCYVEDVLSKAALLTGEFRTGSQHNNALYYPQPVVPL